MQGDRAFTIAAIGDVSFQGVGDCPSLAAFGEALPLFRRADAVIANLESPLTDSGVPLHGKCTLRGSTAWAQILRDAGVTLVSLANNHIMDFGPEGLASTIRVLDLAGIRWVGAGLSWAMAAAPVTLSVAGRRVAVLARTSVVVSAPLYVAGVTPGVAFLDAEETCTAIQRARADADVVVLLLHWGLEEYRYPSPDQRRFARQFVHAGADIIIGHHPHVTQGIEQIRSSVVAYSLGNFLFGEFEWEYGSAAGEVTRVFAGLSPANREGAVLTLTCGSDGQIATRVDPTLIDVGPCVRLDTSAPRSAEMQSLSRALDFWSYQWWWRLHALQREWALRLGGVLSPTHLLRNLHRLRPRHVRMAVQSLRRSANVVSQRSTNPYE